MILKRLYFVLLLLLVSIAGKSQIVLSDSAKVSLLTSSSWDQEIYALFGHTAVRVNDPLNNIDYVFNYGVFDFNTPNFIFRFVKGETDYMLAATDFRYYLAEYRMREVEVTEQIFNLSQKEKQHIWDALCINAMPQNRVYRYNFFFDNCATRPRDLIENNIEGTVQYTLTNKNQTFRDLVHECVNKKPWVEFGIDLVIGSGADRLATDREKMFLPEYLKNAYTGSTVKYTDGFGKNLIYNEQIIIQGKGNENKNAVNYPLVTGVILLLVTIVISLFTYRNKMIFAGKLFDTFLFIVAGFAGCIIFFLMFFSEHPCTSPNWNIIWLNPLQFIVAFLFFANCLSKYIYYYHFINFAVLSLFLIGWVFIPQQMELAFLPYVLSIWIRSGTNFVHYKRKLIRIK